MDNAESESQSETSMARLRANFTRVIELTGHSHDEDHKLVVEIGLLRQEVDRKDEEISKLKQELENLKEKNISVKASLASKDKEISKLKREIQKLKAEKLELENQVEQLQERVGTLNTKVSKLINEVADLKEENGELQGDKLVLEEKVDSLESTVTDMKKDFQSMRSENASLSKKVDALEFRRIHEQEEFGSKYPALEGFNSGDTVASLILGELCSKIQSLIYQKIFPNSFDPRETYHVEYIEDEIESLEDKEERKLAGEMWAKLQTELGWKSRVFAKTMSTIKGQRNMTAHPKINEALLLQSAEQLNGQMYGSATFESVKKLIGIWKKLVETK